MNVQIVAGSNVAVGTLLMINPCKTLFAFFADSSYLTMNQFVPE